MRTMLGVIGGSGVYQIDGLEGAAWVKVRTPWGKPSDEVLVGRLGGLAVAFLPRHGRGHVHDPASVPYRANIDALKRIGCTDVVAVSAVGSLREDFAPGDFVIVEQYIDRTTRRPPSFFGPGCVAHVSLADPTCPRLAAACATAGLAQGLTVHAGATYLAMEGPQFSTRAESRLYRSWGADVIGMTGLSEARLAREAELCYASVAMVTDYDCWHDGHGAVDVAQVIAVLQGNATAAGGLVGRLPALLDRDRSPCPHGCDRALTHALMTAPDKRDPTLVGRLDAVAGRVLHAARMIMALAVLLCGLASGARAETPQFDGVSAPDRLSDADFYRLATCGAPPGGDCRAPVLRWNRPALTLTFADEDAPLPPGFALRLAVAAVQAVDQINAAGAGIRITLVPSGPADITIRPTAIADGTTLVDTPGFSGAGIMGIGFASVWSDEDDIITEAVILISTDITEADMTSVVLEEVTQTLGFLFDVDGPAYEGVSILSQTSNATTTIAGQDAALLRLHYPPN